jgi:hypothetical protein
VIKIFNKTNLLINISRKGKFMRVWRGLILTFILLAVFAVPLQAQPAPAPGLAPGQQAPPLTGPEKRVLWLIAKEAVTAALEDRASREATVEARLSLPQPMVVSIYLDGKLRARTWRLKDSQPLYLEARDLTHEALTRPKVGQGNLSPEDLARAEVSAAVFGEYTQVKDDTEVPPGSGVIVFSGFKDGLALPGDVSSSESAADLLTYACEQAGLRPKVWLLPQVATIFAAKVEEIREGGPGGR